MVTAWVLWGSGRGIEKGRGHREGVDPRKGTLKGRAGITINGAYPCNHAPWWACLRLAPPLCGSVLRSPTPPFVGMSFVRCIPL